MLRELLFDRLKTVVLTSATLAAGGEFDFLESRLGLAVEPHPVTVRAILPVAVRLSRRSACSASPPTFPTRARTRPGTRGAVLQVVTDLALRVGRRHVRAVHQPRGAPAGRGRAPRGSWASAGRSWCRARRRGTQLLRRFRELGNAILLGTDSFWEGVDVPGRALRALVLAKLPFKVPSEPLTAARLERLAEQGEDGFMGYLLPHAALKLKQGFGRLIRTRQRRRRRGAARQAGGDQAVRSAGARGAAPRRASRSGRGRRCGPAVRRLLRPPRDRSQRMIPVTALQDRLRRAQLPRAREGARQRGAAAADDLPQAAVGAARLRASRSCCRAVSTQVEYEAEIGVVMREAAARRQPGGGRERPDRDHLCQRRDRSRPAEDRRPVGPRQGLRHLLPGRPAGRRRARLADPRGHRPGQRDERQHGKVRDMAFTIPR